MLKTVFVAGVCLLTEEVPGLGVAVRGVDGDKLSTCDKNELVITGDTITALVLEFINLFLSPKGAESIEYLGTKKRLSGPFLDPIDILTLLSGPLSLPELIG